MNIEEELKKVTGLEVKQNRFLKAPNLPYIIYVKRTKIRGADKLNNLKEHDITVELYSENIDEIHEEKIENWLDDKNIEYEKDSEWLNDERMNITTYNFLIFEKDRKEIKKNVR